MSVDQIIAEDQEYGLIVCQEGKAQRVLLRYIVLILNFRYGMQIIMAENLHEAATLLRTQGAHIRCVFVVQNEKVPHTVFRTLTLLGRLPVLFLCPMALVGAHTRVSKGLENVYLCAWERAFHRTESSLGNTIGKALDENNVDGLVDSALSPEELQKRIENRLKNMDTLPAMPEIVLRIMRLVSDPDSKVEVLEQVLLSDPSIVSKLLQVVNSPIFAGSGHKGDWNLKEAIVRLGLRKVGAIAQQIKLITSFVKPEDSNFDLRRYWEHSVGCALLADKICTNELIKLETEIEFDDYWIAALLHDIGKMILGLFFSEYFETVVGKMAENEEGLISFRQAETELGDVSHETIGQLLLIKSKVKEEIVEAVQSHHEVGETSSKLTCLISLVNNISKDLDIGYLAEEKGVYDESLLGQLGVTQDEIERLQETLGTFIVPEIKAVVAKCISS